MQILEIIMSFSIGLILLMVTAIIFKSKSSVIFKLIFNAILGFIVLFFLSLISFFNIALNPVNALLTGYLGIFGIGVIYLIMTL